MKTTILYILCFYSMLVHTQSVPNGGFENWHTVPGTNGAEDPDRWESNNKVQNINNGFGVSKSTDARSGNYALKLTPLINSGERYTILTLGNISLDSTGAPAYTNCSGDSVSQLPLLLFGYYQFHKTTSDPYKALGYVNLDPNSCQSGAWMPVGIGDIVFQQSNQYIPFAIPITYSSVDSINIDTIKIEFHFYDFDSTAQGSYLLIDDLQLIGNYLGQDKISKEKISIFPNPVEDFLIIEGTEINNVSVFDQNGRMVRSGSTSKVDMSGLSSGTYYLLIDIGESVFYEKVVKK